jgi:hypothetical protein
MGLYSRETIKPQQQITLTGNSLDFCLRFFLEFGGTLAFAYFRTVLVLHLMSLDISDILKFPRGINPFTSVEASCFSITSLIAC